MRAALTLLAALAWLLTMQPLAAVAGTMSWPDHVHGIEAPVPNAAAAAATTDHDRGDHRGGPAEACSACPFFCCAAALPVLSPPEPREEATRAELPLPPASLLVGRSPTPDPPPPRRV